MENKDIVWGELIPADNGGVKPDWLDDETQVSCYWKYAPDNDGMNVAAGDVYGWSEGFRIRLPADHPHYAPATSIDWTKPLELMDGTPLVLSDDVYGWGDTNPDRDGDYWIRAEDGGRVEGCANYCVSPDTELVRNRAPAEAIPTDPYGPPIEVAGQPKWLGDDETIWAQWFGNHWYREPVETRFATHTALTAIRLPRDHFAYTAIAKGFEPWGGGDEAPGDWDGGEVLRRGGAVNLPASGANSAWTHDEYPNSDIIGYCKRASLLHTFVTDDDAASLPEFDTVTIKRMTEAEAVSAVDAVMVAKHGWGSAGSEGSAGEAALDLVRSLGLIAPDPTPPTPIEAFETENPGIVTDENRHWFELALGWGK